jgi:NAD(P)-dependent dehydrogenase (short-subunit alcohol dehydrogenase family)
MEETSTSSTNTQLSHQEAHISILTTNTYKMATLTFDPTSFIPLLTSKVIFVTGGTAGLGRETILSLAIHNPAHIYFSGRSQSSADKLIAEVREAQRDAAQQVPLTFIRIDLASMSSIKAGAADFLARETRLDLFFANAGVMALPPGLTQDGYEVQFGTNHLGHAALVKLLLPTMERTAAGGEGGRDVRIIWNTSLGYKFASGINFSSLKTPQNNLSPIHALSDWFRYGQSKLANLLYARKIAKRHPSVVSVAIHPGTAFTGLVTGLGTFNRWFVWATTLTTRIPVEQCAWNQQWAAFAPRGEVVNGGYYEPVGVKGELTKAAADDKLAEELWEWTQKELNGNGI